jgi:hypothetical protein
MGEGEEHGDFKLLFECIGNAEKKSKGNDKGRSTLRSGMAWTIRRMLKESDFDVVNRVYMENEISI